MTAAARSVQPPPFTEPEALVRRVQRGQCVAWYGNVQIMLLAREPSMDFMRRALADFEELSAQHHKVAGALWVFAKGTRPPIEQVREAIKKDLSKVQITAHAKVVQTSAFIAAALRGFLAEIQLVSGPERPSRIFEAMMPASSWLSVELGQHGALNFTPQKLAEVAQDLEARLLCDKLTVTA